MIQPPSIDDHPPNWICTVTYEGGAPETWVTHAPTEEELVTRLRRLGYDVVRTREFKLDRWLASSNELRDKVADQVQASTKLTFSERHWQQLRVYLFELFGGLCAYCGARPEPTGTGQVEHYRPKRSVEEDASHPGYWWLAYDLHNYLPACANCNGARNKRTRFPCAGPRVAEPSMADLNGEQPLLLNPFIHGDLNDHLAFYEDGTVEGTTPEGTTSKEVYGLGRRQLKEDRERAIRSLDNAILLAQAIQDPEVRKRELQRLFAEAADGSREFPHALVTHLLRFKQRQDEAWSEVGDPG